MPIITGSPSDIEATSYYLTSRADDTGIDQTLWTSGFYFYFFGVVTLFGGFSAFKAFASTSILAWASRPYLGAYNSPGAYEFAQLLAPLANSPFWDAIFQGDLDDAAKILGLEGRRTAEFLHVSGTIMRAGHPAYLIARHAGKLHRDTAYRAAGSQFAALCASFSARSASESMVTIIDIVRERPQSALCPGSAESPPPSQPHCAPPLQSTTPSTSACTVRKKALREHTYAGVWLLGAFPVYCSCGTLAVCGYYGEWWSFASILLGMAAGACVRFALAPGALKVAPFRRTSTPRLAKEEGRRTTRKRPPSYQPGPSDGIDGGLLLHAGPRGTVVLRAHPDDLARLTGRFAIDIPPGARTKLKLALASLMLDVVAQSVLLPQASSLGQVMFFASILAAAVFNVYCGTRQEAVQTWYLLDRTLVRGLDEAAFKVTQLRSKAGMAVFACLALRCLPEYAPRKILYELVGEDSDVWQQWTCLVARKLERKEPVEFVDLEKHGKGLDEARSSELAKLLGHAEEAYRTQGWQTEDAAHEVVGDGMIDQNQPGGDSVGDEKQDQDGSGENDSGEDSSSEDGTGGDGSGGDGSGEDGTDDDAGEDGPSEDSPGENDHSDEDDSPTYEHDPGQDYLPIANAEGDHSDDTNNSESHRSTRSSRPTADEDSDPDDSSAGDDELELETLGDDVPLVRMLGNGRRAQNALALARRDPGPLVRGAVELFSGVLSATQRQQ